MLRPEDLEDLAATGLISVGAVRLPEGETEPQPRSGECRPWLLSSSASFFRGFLNFSVLNSTTSPQYHHISRCIRVYV